jgi:hypothetical protein
MRVLLSKLYRECKTCFILTVSYNHLQRSYALEAMPGIPHARLAAAVRDGSRPCTTVSVPAADAISGVLRHCREMSIGKFAFLEDRHVRIHTPFFQLSRIHSKKLMSIFKSLAGVSYL